MNWILLFSIWLNSDIIKNIVMEGGRVMDGTDSASSAYRSTYLSSDVARAHIIQS